MNAFNLALIMLFLILIGYISRRKNIVDENFGQSLSVFLFNIVFPAIVISSMSIPFNESDMNNSLILIAISIGTTIIMFLLSLLINSLFSKRDNLSRIITFALMFPNFTFMAFPVMETLFPDKGLFYISMYTIPTRLIIYILGPIIMKGRSEGERKRDIFKNSLLAIITPPVLAIPIGFAIYLTGFQLPVSISETLAHLSRTATPMGMVLSGIILAQASLGSVIKQKRLYILALSRLLIAPIIIYILLMPFGLDSTIYKISVLYAALPIAASTTVFALKYENNPSSAAAGVFLTTILSIITIPLCAYILEFVV